MRTTPARPRTELLARDRLAHELMYFSRGNPVVYYGDEQGFTGTGGDQVARQTMFASQVPEYLDDDLLGTDRTHAQDNFETAATRCTPTSTAWPRWPRTTRRCGTAPTSTATPATRPASTPSPGSHRGEQREYVVALNNSEQPKTAKIPTILDDVADELPQHVLVQRVVELAPDEDDAGVAHQRPHEAERQVDARERVHRRQAGSPASRPARSRRRGRTGARTAAPRDEFPTLPHRFDLGAVVVDVGIEPSAEDRAAH